MTGPSKVTVHHLIGIIEELSTLPSVYSSLLDIMTDPQATVEEVTRIIACDQASTIKILRVVNSPFYGYPGQIGTLSRAILILGFNEIFNLILTSQIIDLFSKKAITLSFRPKDFWAHSIAVGIASRLLGQAAGADRQEFYFIAGALHDIGKLIFFEFLEDQLSQALSLSQKNHLFLYQAELSVIGMDHAEAGALLADKWKLPETLFKAIRFHHTGTPPGEPDRLVAAVHLGDILARALRMGHPGDDLKPRAGRQIWDILGIKPVALKKIIPDLRKYFEDIVSILLF
ncbi:MAG: HDOD domain-containing protein [Deltaproteobacteria bacterium]|nr:HDOD domain-containing protein [Deltaproteobacteria bacterium]